MAYALVDNWLGQLKQEPKQIILDIDATDDPVHGQQEFEFFHGYYDVHCFLPLLVFATVDGEREQHLIASVLRPGNSHAGAKSVSVLSRIVRRIRAQYPNVPILLRGDAGYALPAVYDWCEKENIDYVLSIAKNSRLLSMAEPILKRAREEKTEASLNRIRQFGEISYSAKTWTRERRVIVKAEILQKGENPRFVITNRPTGSAEEVYDLYTDRGDVENRIKEMKNSVKSGRTSCHRFLANQFRLFLHAAAYQLLQRLRVTLRNTGWARSQVETLRVRLLKVAAQVRQTYRKIWVRLPSCYVDVAAWQELLIPPEPA